MNFTIAKLMTETFIVEPNYADGLLARIEENNPQMVGHEAIANNDVTYQVLGDKAVIALDGVMYKKDIGGACFNVVSYNQINKAISKAEADENVKTIIFRVDTQGGSVAGADEVRNRIKKSPKKTITFFENIGASGGMWIFTASDEVYATEMTQLGSIGVIVMYQDRKSNVKTIVSSNAPNKYCDISDPKCKARIQSNLNIYEEKFLDRLVDAYPNKTKEQIVKDFDYGACIFAETAYKLGYLNGVIEFDELIKDSMAVMPSTKIAVTHTLDEKINKKGKNMAEKVEQNATIDQLQEQLKAKDATIEAMSAEVDGLKEKITAHEATIAELEASVKNRMEIAEFAVGYGISRFASKEVILNAMKADNFKIAEETISNSIQNNQSIVSGEQQNRNAEEKLKMQEQQKYKDELLAFAEENSIQP